MKDLPLVFEHELERLSAEAWRERKQAVVALRGLIESTRDPWLLRELAARLIEGLVSPEALEGRAACHEVLVAIGAPTLDELVPRLQSPGPGRRLLVDLLGEIGHEDHVPLLVGMLREPSSDANLRASAATALGRIGGEKAQRVLRELLDNPSDMLRAYALDALRRARASVPVEELEPLVERRLTRKAAAAVLGYSTDPGSLPVLLPLLDDAMAGVRAVAAVSIVQLDETLRERGKKSLVTAALGRISESSRANVRELIRHRDRDVRSAAMRLATMAGDAKAVSVVLEVMDDPLVQEQALAMIGELGKTGGAALAEAAERSGAATREHLLRLMGGLPGNAVGPEILKLLTQGLHDPSEEAAVAAAEALERVGDRSAVGELYRAMASARRLGEAAADALAAVIARSGSASHDDLMLIVGTVWPHDGALGRNLCRVVGKLGHHRYAPHLVSMLGSADVGVRVAAAQALGQLEGDHEGPSALSFTLTDEEPAVRAAACRSLGLLRAPGAYPSLLSATNDRSPMVRAAAVQALLTLENPDALSRFRAIIADDPVPTVVVQAIAGIGLSGLDQDLTMLMSLCTSEDREVVKAAARALVHFPAHRATAALLGLLNHERWDVRWAAAEVLAERGDRTALEPLRAASEMEEDELVRQVLAEALEKLSDPSRGEGAD